ncbi:hypothetical protein [uncultured Gimesia sp.]|uniref:hypothetical protein n=1 Tax=uncultured Gimesia sp. TaxID=1678688 RepID=UPI00261FF052|nr:hypothetical protein [uncultured Gimesia sp.]
MFAWAASAILLCSTESYAENKIPEISNIGQILSYQNSDGEHYFALQFKADRLPADVHSGKQIAILFDTSASQVGEHRTQALDVLKSLLSELPNDSTIAIYAVDVQCTPFVNEFVTPQSRQAKLAVASLAARAPLGATNLAQAVKTAMQGLQNQPVQSMIYIGDGMSAAQLISLPEMAELTRQLAKQHVPVHSYAVGPQKDLQLLGVLGVYTGGVVLTDQAEGKKDLPAIVGKELAKAVQAPVFFPESIQISDKALELNTPQALPVRTDRETVYLAKGELSGRLSVELSSKQLNAIWKFNVPVSQAVNSFLAVPWVNYQPGQELGIAFAGQRMMNLARTAHEENMAQLEFAGTQAIRSGNFEQAAKFGNLLQQLDPGNTRGNSLLKLSERFKQDQLAQADTKQPEADAETKTPPEAKADAKPPIDDAISKVEQLRQIKGAQMKIEVSNAIEEARSITAENPDGALGLLKRTLNFVKSTSDVDIDLRQQLESRLNNMMVDVRSQMEVAETRRIRQQQQLAQLEQQKRLVDKILLEDEKLEQLIDRVRSLIQDGKHGNTDAYEEAEAVSRVAVDMEPGNGPATAALFTSEAAGQLEKVFRMRSLRADRFLETLYQVELSHVPFPDEPPIRWPAAPVWTALTERRKKWAAVDLHRNSPAEQRIFEELQKETEANFPDIPLSEVMTYFAELHNITILINSNDLGEEGLTVDEPVNVALSGIKLKSAMNIILKPIGLTYVIEDEVMKITTIVKADEIYATRVYPVADLVISVSTQQSSVGSSQGGFGGQQGGQGGQGGGLGGGGGGFGGGGQGGGGGGQGFFNIAPELLLMNGANAPKGQKQPAKKAQGNAAKAEVKPIDDPEMKAILDGILSQADSKPSQAQFQVEDNPFQFDNRTIEQLKKKPESVK